VSVPAPDVAPRGARAVTRAWWPLAGVVLLVFAAGTVTRADADLWGHVRFGLDTLRAHALTSTDPYSFTQDRPWVNHEWLSELQMGLAYAALGSTGLALLKGALAFAAFALVWSASRGAAAGVRVGVVIVLAFGSIHMTATLRPQVWTFLCFAILCRVLITDRPRAWWWMPLLFALWANLHGGWIVGLAVLGVWAAADAVANPRALPGWIATVAACLGATLCTPYGWRLWAFMLGTVRMSRSIEEWQPLVGTPALNWVPWIASVTAGLWAAGRAREQRWPALAVLAMLGYASLRVMRIESLFVEAAAILLAPVFVSRFPAPLAYLPTARPRLEWIAALVMFAVPAVAAGWLGASALGCLPVLGTFVPDRQAVHFLQGAEPGRLVTYFDWGEYAIWHLGPRLRVSMDGRRETVYSDRRIAEHDAIVVGSPAGLSVLTDWRPEYVWLPARSVTTKNWLATHGYRIDLETVGSFVAVRADLPHRDAPAVPAPAVTRACFPG